MRVLIASRIFAPEAAAASFRLEALANALYVDGNSVVVLTTRSPDGHESKLPDAVEVRRAPVLRDRSGAVRGYVQYLSFDVPLFLRLLFVRKPNIVVVEPPPTSGVVVRVVCAIRRIPYVYYAADILSDAAESSGSPGPVVRVVRTLERWTLQGAKKILSVSDGVTRRLADFNVSESVCTVGNGVDTSEFSPSGAVHSVDAPYFLYAGTASVIQGADLFVEAFGQVLQKYPKARLVFMGQGSESGPHAVKARSLPSGSVVFEPRQPPARVAEWQRGAQAALASIVPGQGYDFAVPTKVFAAAACGTPVIYAGPGPVHEFMAQADLGWAVEYSLSAVVDAMLAALAAPVDRQERTASANWAAQRVSLKAVAQRAATIIKQAAQ